MKAIRESTGITLFLTSALEGGEGSASHSGRTLPPGKTRHTLYKRLGRPQGRAGQVRKISPPPGFDPRTVQPVASRYTDYATPPTCVSIVCLIKVQLRTSSTIFRSFSRLTTELTSPYFLRTTDNNFNQLLLWQTVRERDIIELGSLYSNFSANQQKSI
jgi:hypothetical protein